MRNIYIIFDYLKRVLKCECDNVFLILVLGLTGLLIWMYGLAILLLAPKAGCHSFICINWKLKNNYMITNYINDISIAYNPTCNCGYCVDTNNCRCNLLKCNVIAQRKNKECIVLRDYSIYNPDDINDVSSASGFGFTFKENKEPYFPYNIWSYDDLQKNILQINSTHNYYEFNNDNNYCYLKNQVEENGKIAYIFVVGFIVTSCYVIGSVTFIMTCEYISNLRTYDVLPRLQDHEDINNDGVNSV